VADLDDGGDGEHVVEAPVAGAGEPMPDLGAAAGIQRRGAGPGREVVAVREAADVDDVGQDPGGAGRADPEQIHQL